MVIFVGSDLCLDLGGWILVIFEGTEFGLALGDRICNSFGGRICIRFGGRVCVRFRWQDFDKIWVAEFGPDFGNRICLRFGGTDFRPDLGGRNLIRFGGRDLLQIWGLPII